MEGTAEQALRGEGTELSGTEECGAPRQLWGQRVSGWDGEWEQDMERCRRQREER